MSDIPSGGVDPQLPATGPVDPTAALQHMITLLKTKNDTSRFVGLALLKSVLDNQPQLREDKVSIQTLWESISPKFLDRLLRAGQNEKTAREEAKDMIDLAVSVLHTFSILLPEESRVEKRLTGRIPSLVNALITRSVAWILNVTATDGKTVLLKPLCCCFRLCYHVLALHQELWECWICQTYLH
jgi:hypothetical protein